MSQTSDPSDADGGSKVRGTGGTSGMAGAKGATGPADGAVPESAQGAPQPHGGGAARAADWPLWEVFVRARRGLSHTHAGSLHAPDAELALRNARDLYTRRGEGVSIWVVPSTAITVPSASSAAPGSATAAGTPSARARIALWLVGPPSSVTKPSTSAGSSNAVSAGARSRATST